MNSTSILLSSCKEHAQNAVRHGQVHGSFGGARRTLCAFVMFVSVSIFASSATAAEIPQGTHVLLRMENSLNTRTAQEGDYVYLRTAVPIASAGEIAVPAGSYVEGKVLEAKHSGRVKGRAQLAIRLETLTLASGKVYKFSPHLSAVDGGDTGQKVVGAENTV